MVRLFAFGVGYDVNTRLLDTLAEDNRGSSDYVLPQEDIEQKVGSLYAKIAYPVLANPRVEWGGMNVYDVYPKRLPDLFKGTQTVSLAATRATMRRACNSSAPRADAKSASQAAAVLETEDN
jgi:Ca-activated chloride channel family protein